MRASAALLVKIVFGVLIVSTARLDALAGAQGDGQTPVQSYTEEILIPEVTSSTDEFGRAPLFRLTFENLAGVGPEDLPPPFVAYVESGTITYRDSSGTVAELGPGSRVDVAADEHVSFRNLQDFEQASILVLLLPGSCLIYANNACMPRFLPYDMLCASPCRPDVTNTLMFEAQRARDRLWVLPMSVYRLAIPGNQIVESMDLGGQTALKFLLIRVESGSIVTNNGASYEAGDEFTGESGDIVVTGSSGATLMVLRVGNPSD